MGMGERNTSTIGEGLGFYKEYVAGMMAGLATVAVGHPFDTVKVLYFSIFDFCSIFVYTKWVDVFQFPIRGLQTGIPYLAAEFSSCYLILLLGI